MHCCDIILYVRLTNEWYVRDSSRKVRAVLKAKAERGERLGTRAPYGYKKDDHDSKKLLVDEEAAAVVRRIFAIVCRRSWAESDRSKIKRGTGFMPHHLCLSEIWDQSHLAEHGEAFPLDQQHDCEYAGE